MNSDSAHVARFPSAPFSYGLRPYSRRTQSKMPDEFNPPGILFWRRRTDSQTPICSPAARAGLDRLSAGFPARRILCSSRRRSETKNPTCFHMPGFQFWRRPTLAQPIVVLPSGLQRFTAVFGMGTGGATALLSPECGTALAVSLLSQRRKREAESLMTIAIEFQRT